MFELYLDLDRRLMVRRGAHGYRFSLELAGENIVDGFILSERGGANAEWTLVEMGEGALALTGHIGRCWKLSAEVAVAGQLSPRTSWQIQATYVGEKPGETAFDIRWSAHIPGAQPFVPGLFYGENRPVGRGTYPRWSPVDEPEDEASSPAWQFRGSRAMVPFTMLRAGSHAAAVVTQDRFSHGESGMGFVAHPDSCQLALHYPYREDPARFVPFRSEGEPGADPTFRVRAGETVCFSFEIYAGRSGGRALMRDLYQDEPEALNPWMPGARAADLAANGLLDWHYDPVQRVLYETAGFDRYFRPGPKPWDRKQMHVAWLSGVPYALALACHGSRVNVAAFVSAGLDVIDKIAYEGIAPGGMFYPVWTEEKGWTGSWVQDESLPPVAHSRTVSEATVFLMRALTVPEGWATGSRLETWEGAARKNLDYALKIQREDGSFGTYYNLETGAVEEWEGAGGMMWIPALLSAARYRNEAGRAYKNRKQYFDAAVKAGGYYAAMVRRHQLAGGPEDVPYGASSEDGYNALVAMLALFEETADGTWLDLACQAADHALSYRMSYNVTFSDETLLGRYDFRSKGADVASPANQCLHGYGYVCLPSLLRLWRLTGDDYYFCRARDQLYCFRQFIARQDGDFNARRGMVPEQWFHTDWTHPKGMVLPVAHAWSAGWIVFVEDWLQTFGTLFIDPTAQRVYCLESVEIVDEDWEGCALVIRNPWDQDIDLTVVNIATADRGTFHLPARQTHVFQI